MQVHQLKIVGAQYAANPEFVSGSPETKEMHVRTCELLQWLKERTPKVVLMKEPTNGFNQNAVMARALGRKIGYVTDSDIAKAYMLMDGREKMLAEIDRVTVSKHGFLFVNVKADMKPIGLEGCGLKEVDWSCWTCDVPLLAQTESDMVEEEAQFMLDEALLPNLSEVVLDEVETYVDLWMQHSHHDISAEARMACSRYIECLETAADSKMRELAKRLKHHRTSMCSRSTSNERAGIWWQSLLDSQELKELWQTWKSRCKNHLWEGLRLIDSLLRGLPGELYNDVGRLDDMFSRLYYMKVPKRALQSILALLMLREQTCMDLSIEMGPIAEDEYKLEGLITDPMLIPTTIGRVVEFGKLQCTTPVQKQTIQHLCNWLRDDYEQHHVKEIEDLAKTKERPSVQFTTMTGANAVYNEN